MLTVDIEKDIDYSVRLIGAMKNEFFVWKVPKLSMVLRATRLTLNMVTVWSNTGWAIIHNAMESLENKCR